MQVVSKDSTSLTIVTHTLEQVMTSSGEMIATRHSPHGMKVVDVTSMNQVVIVFSQHTDYRLQVIMD